MSHQASYWALEQMCATATEKAILMVLASYVGADGTCYPGQDTIARQSCCSVKSVERALQAFEERGWVSRTARRRKDGSRTSDLLELTLASNPEAREQADTMSGRSAPTRHPVLSNTTSCPNQPDKVSGLTTFEPVRIEPVSEPVSAQGATAGNDNDLPFALSAASPIRATVASKGNHKRERFAPAAWQPKPHHVERAEANGIDLARQAELFRNHEFKDGKSDFDRAFTTWLINAGGRFAERPNSQRGAGGGWDPMQQAIDGIDFSKDFAA